MLYKTYFDPVSKGFYRTDINEVIPPLSVEVSEDDRIRLLEGQSLGKHITVENGKVLLVDRGIIPTNMADLIISEKYWRNCELNRADVEISKLQDSDPNSVGTITEWREFRKELRGWPQSTEFPFGKRPTAPDFNKE